MFWTHEWIENDAVEYDLPTEEIIWHLCHENDKLLQMNNILILHLMSSPNQSVQATKDRRA